MKNLFKYASAQWKSMIAIVAILILQAYCDLSLPAYTSDIVNVGIQQGGVEDQIPHALAQEEMDRLLLFVTSDDRQTVLDYYETDDTDYDQPAYVLKDSAADDEAAEEELTGILQVPMMLTAGFESGSEMTQQIEEQLKSQLPEGMAGDDTTIFDIMELLPDAQREAMVSAMSEQMDDMPDSILEQAAVSYVRSAYKNLGMDMDHIQTTYLLVTGGKMTALALLGMLASIAVGFLASRVGASTGRDLRRRVFQKVVGFSNNEFDHFSTATLITRSTRRYPADPVPYCHAAAYRAVCADPCHRRRVPGIPDQCIHVLGNRPGGCADRTCDCSAVLCGDAEVQDPSETGGPCEPGYARDPYRPVRYPRVQYRET